MSTCHICNGNNAVKFDFEYSDNLHDYNFCNACEDIIKKINTKTIDPKSCDQYHSLHILYTITKQFEDGDFKLSKKIWQKTIIFPLLNIFTDSDLDDNGEIDIENKKLRYYRLSDYRGRSIITKAVVKEKKRLINLGRY